MSEVKFIDIDNWNRKKHFLFFKDYTNPHFNLTANADITNLYKLTKENNISSFKAILYIISTITNNIKEFRQRIRGDAIVEHSIVHPSFTVSVDDDLFSYCDAKYNSDFNIFIENVDREIEKVKQGTYLPMEEEDENLIYMTTIPWVSFTSIMHPISFPVDSVPRIAWGKYFQSEGRLKMPLSVQAHHALMDGFHLGKFFEEFTKMADNPEDFILTLV